MKKRFMICVFTMVVVIFSLCLNVEAATLQIEGNRFVKDGKAVYFIVDFKGTHLDVCNAQFIGEQGAMWTEFGGEVTECYKKQFKAQLASLKKSNKIAVIQLFSALLFRKGSADSRDTGLSATVWWGGNVEKSWANFISDKGKAMQKELIDFVISAAIKQEVDFTFSLMWESQTALCRKGFVDWFTGMKDYVQGELKEELKKKFKKEYHIPVGIHCTNEKEKQGKLIEKADFVVDEGDFAAKIGLLKENGDKWKPVLSKPVIILARNPGKFSSGNKCKTYENIGTWEKVAKQLANEMTTEFDTLGSTGYPYARWVEEEKMVREYKDCSKDTKKKMKAWNFAGFAASINNHCKQLLEKENQ